MNIHTEIQMAGHDAAEGKRGAAKRLGRLNEILEAVSEGYGEDVAHIGKYAEYHRLIVEAVAKHPHNRTPFERAAIAFDNWL